MKKQLLVIFVAVMMGILMLSPNTTNATIFTFDSDWNGYDVSGTMNVTFGTGITVVLNNTSDPMNGTNAPAITQFGFDVTPEIASSIASWNLLANGSSLPINQYWSVTMNEGPSNNFSLDFFANSGNVQGGLYSTSAPTNLLGANPYFTIATLTIGLNPTLSELTQYDAYNGYIKFQNIGPDQEGSQKVGVPDASVMLLLGSSFLGFAVFTRKRKKS